MTSSPSFQELNQLLQASLQMSQQLLDVLESEQQILVSGNSEELESCTRRKVECLQAFESLEKQREQLCQAGGYTSDRAGTEACIKQCDQNASLQSLWQELLACIGQCRSRNQENGGVVESSRHHVQHALEVLRGQTGSVKLYQPSGTTTNGLAGRDLGQA